MLVGIVSGIIVFVFVWASHHRIRERLVTWFILRDRSLAWQARERIIASAVCGLCAAVAAGYLAHFFSVYEEYEYIDDDDLYYSSQKDLPRDAAAEESADELAAPDEPPAGDSAAQQADSAGAQPDNADEFDYDYRDKNRPLILVKRNFTMTLKGYIGGKWPVIMELESVDRVLSGSYYDDGRQIDARLEGEVQRNGDCVIQGFMAGDSLVDIFSGIFNNRSFVGAREDPNSGSKLPMKLMAVRKKPLLRSLFGKR